MSLDLARQFIARRNQIAGLTASSALDKIDAKQGKYLIAKADDGTASPAPAKSGEEPAKKQSDTEGEKDDRRELENLSTELAEGYDKPSRPAPKIEPPKPTVPPRIDTSVAKPSSRIEVSLPPAVGPIKVHIEPFKPPKTVDEPEDGLTANERKLAELLNEHREDKNLRTLTLNKKLKAGADENTRIMNQKRASGHYNGGNVAEIAFYGIGSPGAAIKGFLKSPGHRGIMEGKYTSFWPSMINGSVTIRFQ